ncbi:helix-turn-helix domain-containing protein [Microbispora bryophytorum]|uniref:helix-turn-helix domain-containing protein n=1 Tax=Microbispora bryophytorum TaxID=1460882 RepID=UPI0033D08064
MGVRGRHPCRKPQQAECEHPREHRLARVCAEAAAHLLVSTSLPMAAIAARCGFGTAEALRQAFVDLYGIPASRYRSTQATALPSSFGTDT